MNGHRARSLRTRSQLISAAGELIGAVGYEGASTRELAKAANTNLSAIPYHFGGKRELYLAAAQMIAEYARQRFQAVTDILSGVVAPDEKIGRFEDALICLQQVVLEDAEPHSWASFVARCVYDNDEAFALIHAQAIAPLVDQLVFVASEFSSPDLDDEALRLRINTLVTAIIGFRLLRGLVLRGMGWERIQDGHAETIKRMIRDLCRHDLFRPPL